MSAPASPHEEEALGKPYDAALMRRLLRYLRPYLPLTAVAVLMLLLRARLRRRVKALIPRKRVTYAIRRLTIVSRNRNMIRRTIRLKMD